MRRISLTHFSVALDFHMAVRGYVGKTLALAIDPAHSSKRSSRSTIARNLECWRRGTTAPRQTASFRLLSKVEEHFQLREGYFAGLNYELSPTEQAIRTVPANEQSILRWHLPDDFNARPALEREEILIWIRNNVLSGNTEFGQYQKRHAGIKFSIVFPTLPKELGGRRWMGTTKSGQLAIGKNGGYGTVPAPSALAAEMSDLISFKTASMVPRGYRRYSRWCPASATIAAHRYGHLFGALAAAPLSPAMGLGVPLEKLTFGLLIFPAVWDWYLNWCEQRRGSFLFTNDPLFTRQNPLPKTQPDGYVSTLSSGPI